MHKFFPKILSRISHIQHNDETHLYKFIAHNSVVSPPVMIQNPTGKAIMIFGVAKFQCTAKGHNVNMTWLKHDSTIPRTSQIYNRMDNADKITSILEITNAVGFYAGKYCCIAYNKAGNISRCANLTVKGTVIMYINLVEL